MGRINPKKVLWCLVILIWLWGGWLGYEYRLLQSTLNNVDAMDSKSGHSAQANSETHSATGGGSAAKIRELKARLRDSENAARQATDDWLRCHAANVHVHWMENIPTQDVTLEELKELAPEHYNKILKLANERNEKIGNRKSERRTFVEAIKEEWLTAEEHQQLRSYLQLLDTFEDDDLNDRGLGMEERKRLKEQAPSYWRIQDIVKKCCRRMAGGDEGNDMHLEENADEIRNVFKAPNYKFILPEPTIMKTSR
jgi:hypothetical protein